jgi:hypothetical protein
MALSNEVKAQSRIEKTPGVCGGDARVRNTRHTVFDEHRDEIERVIRENEDA